MNKRTHQTCIALIDAISEYQNRIKCIEKWQSNPFASLWTNLEKKSHHEIVIYRACIKRLEERYYKQLKTLTK